LRSLRSYLIAMAVSLVLLLSIGAALLVRELDHSARTRAEGQLLETTRALSSAIDAELRRATGILEALRTSDAMQSEDWRSVDRQARTAFHDRNAWIVITDRGGQQLVNTRLAPSASLPRARTPAAMWRELDRGVPRVCNLTYGAIETQIVCVDVPILRGGRAAYALTLVMRPRYFQTVIDRQHLGDGRLAALIDRQGTIIWRNIRPDQFVGTPATPDMLRALRTASSGVMYSTSLDGVRMMGAYDRSAMSGWTMVSGVPTRMVQSGIDRAAWLGLAGMLACLVLAAAAALLVARRVSRAVGHLTDAAKRIRDGAPSAFTPCGLREIDEVGALLDEAIEARQASEERFALAQEVGGIGAWDWDVVQDRGTVSDPYKEMHGLTHVPDPLKIADVQGVIHPDDLNDYLRRMSIARGRRETSEIEYRVVHPDGSVRWISGIGRPFFDASGAYVRAAGIVRDVTREREAQLELERLNQALEARIAERTAQLAESERRFRAIFDTTFQLTSLATLDGTILVVNQAVLDAAETTLDGIVGTKIWEASWWATNPDETARIRNSIERVAAGAFVRYESTLQLPGGNRRFDFSMKPVLDDAGRPSFLVAEGRDITDLKHAEAALHQSQKLDSLGQLTGGVAHDFNNLLTPIIGSLDLLHRRVKDESREHKLIGGALQSAEKARAVVQRLLAFARRQPLQAGAVDAAALVEGMAELLSSTLGPRVQLMLELEPGVAPVHADANQIEMAILNLAVNARDAMPDGGTLTISLANAPNAAVAGLAPGDYVRLSVRDTGCGMDEETARRAVEPFFSTKGVGQGTGLGLSMIHGLAGQLGGALTIETERGRGTAIHLWLPVSEAESLAPSPARAAPGVAASRTILLVDDDELVRASTAAMLAELDHRVVEAHSTEEARRMVEAGLEFDLLMTDYLMPGASGGDLVAWVAERRPRMPALVITGYAGAEGLAPTLTVLSKPFRRDDLARAIHALLVESMRGDSPSQPRNMLE